MAKRIVRLVLLLLGIGLLTGATLFVALRWDGIPDEVAVSFNGAGQPDSYESKGALWGMLGAGWFIFCALSVIVRVPALWRTNGGIVRFTSVRVGGRTVLGPTWLSLDLIALEAALLFSYMAFCSARRRPLGAWFLPAFFGAALLSFVVPGVLMKDRG